MRLQREYYFFRTSREDTEMLLCIPRLIIQHEIAQKHPDKTDFKAIWESYSKQGWNEAPVNTRERSAEPADVCDFQDFASPQVTDVDVDKRSSISLIKLKTLLQSAGVCHNATDQKLVFRYNLIVLLYKWCTKWRNQAHIQERTELYRERLYEYKWSMKNKVVWPGAIKVASRCQQVPPGDTAPPLHMTRDATTHPFKLLWWGD